MKNYYDCIIIGDAADGERSAANVTPAAVYGILLLYYAPSRGQANY